MTDLVIPSPDNVRRLVATALQQYADRLHDKAADDPGAYDLDSVIPDIAWAHALADHVTGWTHTTRLREYLEAGSTVDAVDETEQTLRSLFSEVNA